MTRLEEVNREVNMHSSVRYLGYLARINLLVAICLGLYVRWEKTANSLILVIFILGLFVLGIASILYYYFSIFNIEIIIDSQEAAKIVQRGPMYPSPRLSQWLYVR